MTRLSLAMPQHQEVWACLRTDVTMATECIWCMGVVGGQLPDFCLVTGYGSIIDHMQNCENRDFGRKLAHTEFKGLVGSLPSGCPEKESKNVE